jgi:hypothetical protein
MGLMGLATYLASGDPGADPAREGVAWMVSEEGKRFMTLSSERWCEADIAAGAPENEARAAAGRTAAAYTA